MVIVVILLVLIGVGVASLLRSREKAAVPSTSSGTGALPGATPPAAVRSSVRGLRVGDVVNHDGHDCLVDRTYRFREGGSRWEEHLLVDGDFRVWLSVEDDEGLDCQIWTRNPLSDLEPGPQTIELDGVTYSFDEKGRADYTLEEANGPGGSGVAEYYDYDADGGRYLSFEKFDGSGWEISVGQDISEHSLDIYPGS